MVGNSSGPRPNGAQNGSVGRGPTPSLMDRLSQTFLRPPKPKAEPERVVPTVELTEAEKAAAIRQIDARERKMGYLGSALVVILSLLAFAPYVSNPHKPVAETINRIGRTCPPGFKGTLVRGAHKCAGNVYYSRGHWVLEMVVVLFFAAFLFVATRLGRRSGVAFAALFAGLALEFTTGSIIGIIFVFGGGWLLMRAWRVQKYGSPDAKVARAVAAERRSGSATSKGRNVNARATGGTKPRRGRGAKGGADPATGRKAPTPSKRYTPKTPQRKHVPPAT